MPAFHLAVQTRRGISENRDVVVGARGGAPNPITAPARIALAHQCADPDPFSVRARLVLRSATTPEAVLRALAPEACLCIFIDPATFTAIVRAMHASPLHFLRLADATVRPLPSDPAPLTLEAGDTYLALTPGALAVADSPAIARFIHMRDDFDARKMAAALLDYLIELAGTNTLPEDITVLVLEAR